MMQESGFSIRVMAARCGMTVHTLRYYERVGLIQSVQRGPSGHRRYSDQDRQWLEFLKALRATHMPIRDMQRYVALHNAGNSRAAEQCKLLEEHRAALEKQIAELQNAQILLTHGIERVISLDEREAHHFRTIDQLAV